MRTTRATEIVAAAVGAVIALSLIMPGAVAAPPGNDDIRSAEVIATVPAWLPVDTREATTLEDETPDSECLGAHSVWYRLQPERGFTGRVKTSSSDFDPMIGIFTGQPDALELVECNDNADLEVPPEAGATIEFQSGHTYFIVVNTCCDRFANHGGHTVLSLFEPRSFTFSAPTTRTQAGDISGTAVISGTARCVNPNPGTSITLNIEVQLRQRIGSRVVRGTGSTEALCTSKTSRWSIMVDGQGLLAFRPGKARMTITMSATSDDLTSEGRSTTRTIRLRKAPNLE